MNSIFKFRREAAIFSTAVYLFLITGAVAAKPVEYDLAGLQGGEIMLQTIHGDKPGGAARVTALFHGTADEVWNVIGDCKYEFIYIRGLRNCEVLEPDKRIC